MEALEQSYSFSWTGDSKSFLDQVDITSYHHMYIGRFGGAIAYGAYKNENGCLLLTGPDWELAVLCAAENTTESAALIIETLMMRHRKIDEILSEAVGDAVKKFDNFLLSLFNSVRFRSTVSKVSGYTSCLIAIRKETALYWFSVGSNALYFFSKEDTTQLNPRNTRSWIGERNTFDEAVPNYTMGIISLTEGMNQILMTTDSLRNFPVSPYKTPSKLKSTAKKAKSQPVFLKELLGNAQAAGGTGSITLIGWNAAIS